MNWKYVSVSFVIYAGSAMGCGENASFLFFCLKQRQRICHPLKMRRVYNNYKGLKQNTMTKEINWLLGDNVSGRLQWNVEIWIWIAHELRVNWMVMLCSFQFETESEGTKLRRDVLAGGNVGLGPSTTGLVAILSGQEEMFAFRRAVCTGPCYHCYVVRNGCC